MLSTGYPVHPANACLHQHWVRYRRHFELVSKFNVGPSGCQSTYSSLLSAQVTSGNHTRHILNYQMHLFKNAYKVHFDTLAQRRLWYSDLEHCFIVVCLSYSTITRCKCFYHVSSFALCNLNYKTNNIKYLYSPNLIDQQVHRVLIHLKRFLKLV